MFIEQEDYNEIKRTFPINAVELLVFDKDNNVLMFKRLNEPAKDQWWIPGGRVLNGESRKEAAKRLAKDECGITVFDFQQFETLEYSVKNNTDNYYQHIISTVYKIKTSGGEVEIDSQTSEYSWRSPSEWLKFIDDDFIKYLLIDFRKRTPASFLREGLRSQGVNGFIRPELYDVILRSLTVPCTDIILSNAKGEILLVKRKNEPAKNLWWVPGGRVLFGEKRIEAAERKLREECGLPECINFKEICNIDFIYTLSDKQIIHDISLLFEAEIITGNVILDEQSSDYSWRSASDWLNEDLHVFIRDIMKKKLYNGQIKELYN